MKINKMQFIVDVFLTKLGVNTTFVYVKSTNKITAATIGGQSSNSIIQTFGFNIPAAVGVILVDEKYLEMNDFNDSEINFILAHECIHIFKNHIISTLFWNLLEQYLKGEANENEQIVELGKAIYLFTSKGLPPNTESLRNQEYEADKLAVINLTHDLDSAISCLIKLSNGDLDSPSHTWELFDQIVPAMTMRQRIQVLKQNME